MAVSKKSTMSADTKTNLEQVISEPKKSVKIDISVQDAQSLEGVANYLYSRPMNEVEGGVLFLRSLLDKIRNA